MEQSERDRLKETFAAFIKSKKMRQTSERFVILDKVLDQSGHFDIDKLYNDLESDYHVSRTTVYNTIELLSDCNILRKHFLNDAQAIYEHNANNQLHMICLKCGSTKHIQDERTEEFLSGMKTRGFHPSYASFNIYGLCSACMRKMRKSKKNSIK